MPPVKLPLFHVGIYDVKPYCHKRGVSTVGDEEALGVAVDGLVKAVKPDLVFDVVPACGVRVITRKLSLLKMSSTATSLFPDSFCILWLVRILRAPASGTLTTAAIAAKSAAPIINDFFIIS